MKMNTHTAKEMRGTTVPLFFQTLYIKRILS